MSAATKTVRSWLGRGHIADQRLDEIATGAGDAATGASGTATATATELDHLAGCRRCRSLLAGFRRTSAVLTGAWSDRELARGLGLAGNAVAIGPVRPRRLVLTTDGHISRVGTLGAVAAAVLVGTLATASLVLFSGGRGLRPADSSSAASLAVPTAPTSPAANATPQRTGLVARLPIGRFSWAPDSRHLLVVSADGSVVYDAFANQVSRYGQFEGWLDSGHLISGNGHIAAVGEDYTGGPKTNSWVVAGGHGAAAIIVAVPGCTGDPIIDWYKNGGYVRAQEKATPYGWSADGKLALLGHFDCSDPDAEIHGWKGPVDVVDFATGKVLATAPAVRGDMAFNPSGTRLAAQSDNDLEIVDIATGAVKTVPGVRLLGWADDEVVYVQGADGRVSPADATDSIRDLVVDPDQWQVRSPAGAFVDVDKTGRVLKIAGADAKTTLLDLSSASLALAGDRTNDYVSSSLQARWWSPDGRLLVLPSADGTELDLFSVDDLPGSVASALPTPIGSPVRLATQGHVVLPGTVHELLADYGRDALWSLSGTPGGPIVLDRYDVASGELSSHSLAGTSYDADRNRLALAPSGDLWISAGVDIVVYNPGLDRATTLTLPATGPDVEVEPGLGRADPWIAGIAFDGSGDALVARNWVRSLAIVDKSMQVTGSIDISDGFAMTGQVAVAGDRVFVVADPATGFGFGAEIGPGGQGPTKFTAPTIAAVGDRLLTAGTPPGWLDADGSGEALIGPAMTSATIVVAGPGGISALYDGPTNALQWRDKDGKVALQGTFAAVPGPRIVSLAFDASGALWAVANTDTSYELVRLGPT
jgi:WD40 repeat protein